MDNVIKNGSIYRSGLSINKIFNSFFEKDWEPCFMDWDYKLVLLTDDLEFEFPNSIKEKHLMSHFEKIDTLYKKLIIENISAMPRNDDLERAVKYFFRTPYTYNQEFGPLWRGVYYALTSEKNSNYDLHNENLFYINKDRLLVEKYYNDNFKNTNKKNFFKILKFSTDLNFYCCNDYLSAKFLNLYRCLPTKSKDKYTKIVNTAYDTCSNYSFSKNELQLIEDYRTLSPNLQNMIKDTLKTFTTSDENRQQKKA